LPVAAGGGRGFALGDVEEVDAEDEAGADGTADFTLSSSACAGRCKSTLDGSALAALVARVGASSTPLKERGGALAAEPNALLLT
jgi:hypothetical protein